MLTDGLVSTILPVHNRASMLVEAVASVLEQDYRPIEIIIVDDGSTDDTGEAADALAASYPEIRVAHRANGGPGAARETGRRMAAGEFIQYLDSDDRLLPRKFARLVAALQAEPTADVAYGQTRFVRADGIAEPGPWKGSGQRIAFMFPSFLSARWWDTPNPIYRRSACDRAGPWLETRLEEDWEYDCRIAAAGGQLAYVAEFVCEVRDHDRDRLSRGVAIDAKRLKDRALAHRLMWKHAKTAGLSDASPEVKHFARELFLLARQCGAAGLSTDAADLFTLAREASTSDRKRALDFRLYRGVAAVIGWHWAGLLSMQVDRLRT